MILSVFPSVLNKEPKADAVVIVMSKDLWHRSLSIGEATDPAKKREKVGNVVREGEAITREGSSFFFVGLRLF
jgi:hypothetical protein